MIVGNTFFQHKDIHKYTREMPSRDEKSIIDLLIIEENKLKRIRDIEVRRGCEIGSGHYLVMVINKTKPTGEVKQKKVVRTIEYVNIRTKRLQNQLKKNIREK